MNEIEVIQCQQCKELTEFSSVARKMRYQCIICRKFYSTRNLARDCEVKGHDAPKFPLGTKMAAIKYDGSNYKVGYLHVGKVVGYTHFDGGHKLGHYNVEYHDGTDLEPIKPEDATIAVATATMMIANGKDKLP